MSTDPNDIVKVGDDLARLMPTNELRFVMRQGIPILQQKWSATGIAWRGRSQINETVWRWKDVAMQAKPEPDSV